LLLFTQEAGHPPNVVVYTTLLKGYATVGDVATALRLLSSMQQQRPPVPPDVRSINTFLRGCVRVGDLAAAWNVFQQLKAKWKVIGKNTPESSRVYESVYERRQRSASPKSMGCGSRWGIDRALSFQPPSCPE